MTGAINLSQENDLNYANFLDRLHMELERSKRYNRSFSICVFSLGGGGSEILAADVKPFLRELSRLISEVSRIPDIVVSCSSEELALIMPETPIPGAFTAADRLRKRLTEQVFKIADAELKLTVSMGVAAFPEHGADTETLFQSAKQAMEMARTREPNSIVSASELSE